MVSTHPLKVYLVEDSTLLRDRLIKSLSRLASVEIVGSSATEQDAIIELASVRCDALVLDMQLQDGSGLNVLRAVRRSDTPEHHTLVIMLTNYASSIYRTRCLEAGADFFLDKAHDTERVEEILSAAAEDRFPD
jgi:DNA-binding NarL/FixJ family response regulator